MATLRGSAIEVLWTVRTGALRGGCFPESLWSLCQTAERGVVAVREETYERQLLVTDWRIIRLSRAEARLNEMKAGSWCTEFLL